MRFGVLGPLAVWTDRGDAVTIPGRKVRALLAALLVHEGRTVSADRLVDDLWGATPPADPTAALHVRVSQLRRALAAAEPGGRDLVVSQAPGYALRPDADVDARTFAALVDQARAADDARARAALLGQALALWRGPALADFADEEFARAAVARWEERRLAALEAYAEARLDLGEHQDLVGELAEHVARHPLRERLRAAHIRALYRSGRPGDALDSFQDLRRRLADELGLDPGPELVALQRAILANDPSEAAPAPPPPPARPATNLPAPVTTLIGREHAVRRVRELLATARLVTLTGPGGVGKTSLALTVAHEVAAAYPDGAWLVDLTTWQGRGEPAEAVLAVLSIPDAPGDSPTGTGRLVTTVRRWRALLVLDNCEHVVEPVATLVAELLAAAPDVRVLATSREPLRLRGEVRWDVPPLELPGPLAGATGDAESTVARAAAVRLFLDRAGLAPRPDILADVAEICRRLDGIPLALELAAARVPSLGLPELSARLRVPRDRFGVLGTGPRDAPARQRTLTAVIDWSWRLLSVAEQTVLRRLAVHAGGFTLAAAEAVCAGDGVHGGEVLDLVAGLVDRSLVARDGESRFRLLETVGAYCLDRLREAGEEPVLRRQRAEYYLALAESAEPRLRGPEQREWLRRLDVEAANLRAASDTFRREQAAEPALRLASALAWAWFLRGRLGEARRVLAEARAVPGAAPAAVRLRADTWYAGFAIRQRQAGPELAAEVLRGYEQAGDAAQRAWAEWFLAASTVDLDDPKTVEDLLASALERYRATGDRWGEAAVLSTRAMLAHLRGDLTALEDDARRSAALFEELGDAWGSLQATDWLIGLADLTGDLAEAARLSREGMRIAEELGLWGDVAGRAGWLAWICLRTGDYRLALEHGERAWRLAVEQGQRSGEVFAALSLASAARRLGRLDQAVERLRWLLDSARREQGEGNHPPYLSTVLVESGFLAAQRGDAGAALTWHREGFDKHREEGSEAGMAWALVGMADALVRQGRSALAAELLGAADAARRHVDQPLSVADRQELDRITAAVRSAEPEFATWFARGGELPLEQARSRVDRDRA